jgi:hypothetical protein
VVDQLRTALTVMVAEIRANMPDRALIPAAEVATKAVTGKRNQINLPRLRLAVPSLRPLWTRRPTTNGCGSPWVCCR